MGAKERAIVDVRTRVEARRQVAAEGERKADGRFGGTILFGSPLSPMVLADEINMVRRHIQSGERHIAEQRGRVLELQLCYLPTDKAKEFLRLLESLQDFHHVHLERLLEKAQSRNAA